MQRVSIRRQMRRLVRAYAVSVALVMVMGLGLTLPPGPLCDEGM